MEALMLNIKIVLITYPVPFISDFLPFRQYLNTSIFAWYIFIWPQITSVTRYTSPTQPYQQI